MRRSLILLMLFTVLGTLPTYAQDGLTDAQILFMIKEVKPDAERVGLMWHADTPDKDNRLTSLTRMATNLGVKIFLAEVHNMSDVGDQFRNLTRTHGIQVLWVVGTDDVLNGDATRGYLIKNATESKLPLIAPAPDWVDEGATITFTKQADSVKLIVNQAGAQATSLTIPEKYAASAQYFAAN